MYVRNIHRMGVYLYVYNTAKSFYVVIIESVAGVAGVAGAAGAAAERAH